MENRIKLLERKVNNILRGAHSKLAVAMVTPYPISNAVIGDDIKGTILRYMFSGNGAVKKGHIKLGDKPRNGVELELKVTGVSGVSTSTGMVITKEYEVVKLDEQVKEGSRIEIILRPLGETVVTEVWVSFLWVPHLDEVEKKQFVIKKVLSIKKEAQ